MESYKVTYVRFNGHGWDEAEDGPFSSLEQAEEIAKARVDPNIVNIRVMLIGMDKEEEEATSLGSWRK